MDKYITLLLADGALFIEESSLIELGQYFKRLLDGSFNDVRHGQLKIPDLKSFTMRNMLDWKNKGTLPVTLPECIELFTALDKYQVEGFDFSKCIRELPRTSVQFLLAELQDVDSLIDAIASHYRYSDDLSSFDDELTTAILTSKYCRMYGEGLMLELLLRLEAIAEEEKTFTERSYVIVKEQGKDTIVDKIFKAHGVADLMLQYRDWACINYKNCVVPAMKCLPAIDIDRNLKIRKLRTTTKFESTTVPTYAYSFGVLYREIEGRLEQGIIRNKHISGICLREELAIDVHGNTVVGCGKVDSEMNGRHHRVILDSINADLIIGWCPAEILPDKRDYEPESEQFVRCDVLHSMCKWLSDMSVTVEDLFSLSPDRDKVILALLGKTKVFVI